MHLEKLVYVLEKYFSRVKDIEQGMSSYETALKDLVHDMKEVKGAVEKINKKEKTERRR